MIFLHKKEITMQELIAGVSSIKSEAEALGKISITPDNAESIVNELNRISGKAIKLSCELAKEAENLLKRVTEADQLASELTEKNKCLKTLHAQARDDKKDLECQITSRAEQFVLPYLKRMDKPDLHPEDRILLRVAIANLEEILSPYPRKLHGIIEQKLTPRECEIAQLVKMGKTSKEISSALGLTKRAVEFHRDQLRNKLGLKKKKQNLRAYLASI
jgi:DNA-binding CsgD family transcriptional regulator